MNTLYEKALGMGEVRFGTRRKFLALAVIAFGIFTFFVPLVTANPAVLDKTHWSMFDILWHTFQGDLLPSRNDLVFFPIDVALVYLLMPIAFYAVVFARSQRAMIHIPVIGMILILHQWNRAGDNFEITLYRNYLSDGLSPGRHVAFDPLILALCAVMGSLLFVAVSERLDAETASGRPCEQTQAVDREPEFLDVEILPPEEKAKPRDDPRRLHD